MDRSALKALVAAKRATHRPSRIKAAGSSMFPIIVEDDLLVVDHVIPEDLHVGDLGVFWTGNVLMVHRVIGVLCQEGERYFLLKGDNSPEIQEIQDGLLFGKVREIHREGWIVCFKEPFWGWVNYLLGHFMRIGYGIRRVLISIEHRIPGIRTKKGRFLPSRLLFGLFNIVLRRFWMVVSLFKGSDVCRCRTSTDFPMKIAF